MLRRVTWLLVPLGWALACGGRFDRNAGDDGDGDAGSSTGQGGSAPARAGASSTPGNPGKPGSPGGGGKGQVGTGGAVSAAGALPVGGVGIGANGPGGTFSMGEGGFGCIQDPVPCPPGFEVVWLGDNCAVGCGPSAVSCYQMHQNYVLFREQLLDKYRVPSCSSNQDCSVYFEQNACGNQCGISISKQFLGDFDLNLNLYAERNCSPLCPQAPEPPCDPIVPSCWKGYCE